MKEAEQCGVVNIWTTFMENNVFRCYKQAIIVFGVYCVKNENANTFKKLTLENMNPVFDKFEVVFNEVLEGWRRKLCATR
jgi:hypothetical protein